MTSYLLSPSDINQTQTLTKIFSAIIFVAALGQGMGHASDEAAWKSNKPLNGGLALGYILVAAHALRSLRRPTPRYTESNPPTATQSVQTMTGFMWANIPLCAVSAIDSTFNKFADSHPAIRYGNLALSTGLCLGAFVLSRQMQREANQVPAEEKAVLAAKPPQP
jgi:hypothetical protein